LTERPVAFFGVSRTLPATERRNLTKCSYSNFESVPSTQTIDAIVLENAARILGKNISSYRQVDLTSDFLPEKISLLQGQTDIGEQFSEFHFGAGESNIIRMLQRIESLEENSLVLIEEIENGLHPVAQRRLVEYLIEVAKRKKIQTIFTTHSNDALMPLPSQAIWACINNKLYQGKLDIRALRAINGETEASLAIFVEDEFAKAWISAILANSDIENAEDKIEIFDMRGDGNAVKLHRANNENPVSRCKSICILDGDSEQQDDETAKIFRLPDEQPEKYIYDSVQTILSETESTIAEFCALIHKTNKRPEEVLQNIQSIGITNRDPHLLFAQIAEQIGFVSEITVRDAFLHLWVENYNNDIADIIKSELEN
jgi:hypothetical protein